MAEGTSMSGLLTPKNVSDEDKSTNVKSSRKSRAILLENALEKTANKFISSLTLLPFAKAYPKHYENNPEGFKSLHSQLLSNMSSNIKDEFKEIIEEQNVVEKLDKLEDMCATASSQPAWRPSGNPDADVQTHLVKSKKEAKEKLVEELQKRKEGWSQISTELMKRRQKINNLYQNMLEMSELNEQASKECDEKLLHLCQIAQNHPIVKCDVTSSTIPTL